MARNHLFVYMIGLIWVLAHMPTLLMVLVRLIQAGLSALVLTVIISSLMESVDRTRVRMKRAGPSITIRALLPLSARTSGISVEVMLHRFRLPTAVRITSSQTVRILP